MRRRDFLYLAAGAPIGLALVSRGFFESAPSPAAGAMVLPQGRTLPAWFLENRVQMHSRLGLRRWGDKSEFEQYSRVARELGANVITRHVKSRDEAPWWPSRVEHNGSGTDVAKRIIDEAHANGLHMIGYYWHMAEVTTAKRHPDWLCHDNGGEVSKDERGDYLDITGPFREVVLGRLLELGERGIDGFYFDHTHLPRNGCWDSALAKAFQAETGKAPARRGAGARAASPDFLIFQAQKIAETFEYWQNEVHRRHPGIVFVVSTTFLPALINVRTSARLASVVDSPKTEFRLAIRQGSNENVFRAENRISEPRADVRMALGWATLRDAADGRPPHVWSQGFPNGDHMRAFTGAVVTWGCIANMDLHEEYIVANDAVSREQRAGIKSAFDLGKPAGPTLGRARPLRWAAVHFAEGARNQRSGDSARVMREVGWPLTGAFGAFIDAGLPVGVVTDEQLTAGSVTGYRVLFLPTPGDLSQAQRRAVDAFRAGGGMVIEQASAWSWHTAGGQTAAARALLKLIEAQAGSAPVQALNLPEGVHAVAYQGTADQHIYVALTNRFTWVQEESPTRRIGAGKVVAPPQAVSGIRLRLARSAARATELVSGSALAPRDSGRFIDVPALRTFSLVRIEPA